MSPVWKYLLGLAVVLPLGGYVAGSLVATSGGDPAPREVIVIQDAPAQQTSPGTTLAPAPSPSPSSAGGQDASKDDGEDDGEDDVPVIRPEPDDLEDEPDEDEPDEDEADEDEADERDDDGDDD